MLNHESTDLQRKLQQLKDVDTALKQVTAGMEEMPMKYTDRKIKLYPKIQKMERRVNVYTGKINRINSKISNLKGMINSNGKERQ